MKLINRQKQENFLKTENSKTLQVTAEEIKEFPQTYMIAAFSDGVLKGIEFAESELQNLAIEFAEFLRINYYVEYSNFYIHNEKGEKIYYTNNELFKIFISEQNK